MIKTLRWVGCSEGISLLLLLFIAMPLKYIGGDPTAVRLVGTAHGGLFVAYVALLALATMQWKWPLKQFLIGFILSSVPFGTFYFDSKYLKRSEV